MTEKQEKELINFVAQHTEKGRHLESGKDMWGIRDVPEFVKLFVEFLESRKK